jgi:CheY-like chemotaxis protein
MDPPSVARNHQEVLMSTLLLVVSSSSAVRGILSGLALAEFSDVAIESSTSPQEAFPLLKRRKYDGVLCGLEAGPPDALELCRWMRQTEANQHTPFILFGPLEKSPDREQLNASGVDHYLASDSDRGELSRLLYRAVDPRARRRAQRYSIPGMTASLRIDHREHEARVINLSQNGALLDLSQPAEADVFYRPAWMTLHFPQRYNQPPARDIYTALVRLTVMALDDDHHPSQVRMARVFIDLPDKGREIIESVLNIEKKEFTLNP